MRLPLAFVLLAACSCSRADAPCGTPDRPCVVEGGQYFAREPAGWDGASPVPLTVFFHGWSQTPMSYYDRGTGQAIDDAGALGVYPEGLNDTWAHQGSPSQARDEIDFMDAVLADVRARWPVDEGRTLAAGMSQGGSMTWWLACNRGDQFTGFAPVAGAFWEPMPTECPTPPANLYHTHGTADRTVPLEGRALGSRYAQGDVREGLALWRGIDGCADEPSRTYTDGPVTCEVWEGCASGKQIQLCLHSGGHSIPDGWSARAHAWRESL